MIGGVDCAAMPVMHGVCICKRMLFLIAIALLEVGSSWLGTRRGGSGNRLERTPLVCGEVVEVAWHKG